MPKNIPVNIFHKPEKTRVADSDIELFTTRATIRGSKVPRSPNEPDISESGERRKASTLLECKDLTSPKFITSIFSCGKSTVVSSRSPWI